jgi:hypothetical protein
MGHFRLVARWSEQPSPASQRGIQLARHGFGGGIHFVSPGRVGFVTGGILFLAFLGIASCVKGQPASDVSDPGSPLGPTPLGTRPLAYVQDIKPVFDRDCLECHGGREARGDYSTATYEETLAGQRPGDASSRLVVVSSPGGSMYQYFSGDAVTKATMVFRWMVVDHAAQTR